MIRIQTADLPVDRIDCDLVVALYFADVRPLSGPAALLDWRLNGFLTRLLRYRTVSGEIGEDVMTPGNHKIAASRVLFVGSGHKSMNSVTGCRDLLRRLLRVCRSTGFANVALCLFSADAPVETGWRQLLEEEAAAASGSEIACYLILSE